MDSPSRALVVIDVQRQYAAGALHIQYPAWEDSLARVGEAIEVAADAGMPIAVVQHLSGEGAPTFDPATAEFEVVPEVVQRLPAGSGRFVKKGASALVGTGLGDWLGRRGVSTVSLVGYMTNNCVLATAVTASMWGLGVEVLSDATGAVHLANCAGSVSAQVLHESLMVLLQSNWAAVAGVRQWADAVAAGAHLPPGTLVTSACAGERAVRRGRPATR